MNTIENKQVAEEPEVILDEEFEVIPETEEPEVILDEEPEESEETIEYNTKLFKQLLNVA